MIIAHLCIASGRLSPRQQPPLALPDSGPPKALFTFYPNSC